MKSYRQKIRIEPPIAFDSNRFVLLVLVGLTLLRTVAVAISPLELGVDEAQYWLWSQSPDFGYFTKPPLIAWIIGAAHWAFGHSAMAIRLPACWLQLATALVLWQTASWLYGKRAGRLTALIWISLPAVGLGSFLISTDTPLLLAMALALLALAGSVCGRIPPWRAMTYAGIALGIGMLTKYASIYGLLGFMLIWAFGRHHPTPIIQGRHLLLAIAVCLITVSPNLIWNLMHDFSTIRHLGDNANLTKHTHDIGQTLVFLISQAGVAGPLVFFLMLGIILASRREKHAGWLVWMAVPVISLISLQAYLSEANANWAMAAYPAMSVWLGGWLGNYGNQRTLLLLTRKWLGAGAIGLNFILAIGLLLATMAGSLGPLTPTSDPLRRLRGWQALAQDIEPHLAAHQTSRIIADRRATAALLSWHFYGQDVTIMIHDRDGVPSNHFEANHSWQHRTGSPLLVLSRSPKPPIMPPIEWQDSPSQSEVVISHNKSRDLYIHKGIE